MSGTFGAALDAWLTTQPEPIEDPLPGDDNYPRCSDCGAFLRRELDRREYSEMTEHCDGRPGDYVSECGEVTMHDPHTFTEHAWETLIRRCRRCGHENQEIAA